MTAYKMKRFIYALIISPILAFIFSVIIVYAYPKYDFSSLGELISQPYFKSIYIFTLIYQIPILLVFHIVMKNMFKHSVSLKKVISLSFILSVGAYLLTIKDILFSNRSEAIALIAFLVPGLILGFAYYFLLKRPDYSDN